MVNKILIVDDEQPIRTLLDYNLKQSNFETIMAADGAQAIQQVEEEKPDLILLDLMLPIIDGIEVCKILRSRNINTPIIMLTAKGEEPDKVLGLEIGADDYMTKPFSPREVIARVKAVLRRSQESTGVKVTDDRDHIITSGPLTVHPEQYEAYLREQSLEFTPKEFELLVYFMQNKNRVLTREQLLSAVWNYDFVGDTRIVDVHVSHLREKIEENTKKPLFIKTVRGIGYKFEEQKVK
ncbi:response regulator transcription factor [Sporosarcina thermotolerans]|uniref:Response regulator transcription factor n=1 Tax=Sporosarcina thermotolerans TaxID=633404 RepID=A0AAW9ABX8_9BACL|nr:response regulator transcription factor [Sporosarcina thermotolerans]MDW0118460.1 response regulator transcription factor [Sporosarcina thermotolerans]WHT49964.1 response regulator transcription factor [Sporosarcina thermotolerans]